MVNFKMKDFVGMFLIAGFIPLCLALTQSQLDNLADNMSIKAKATGNLRYTNHTVKLTIRNTGNSPIPANDWRLYFHSMYLVQPDVFPKNMTLDLETQKIRLGMVQGDLYFLEPLDGFVPIQQNDIREYYIVAAWWSISRTDFMPNWYLTADGTEPRIVKSTSSLDLDYVEPIDDVREWKRFADDRYNPYTAQQRMRRLGTDDLGKVGRIVLPTPKEMLVAEVPAQQRINLDSTWKIYTDVSEFKSTANYLAEIGLQLVDKLPAQKYIVLSKPKDTTERVRGAYQLRIDTHNQTAHLTSGDVDGIFYAVQSLRSILDGYNTVNIPAVIITDEPRYQYRGMYIDVARNFHTVEDIKRLMTAMSMYKLNKLHLHLSDDEGWRIEIPDLPELTEVGGRRCHDLQERTCVIPQFGSGPFANSSGSGFYTVGQYKDLLRFAVENHIQVIPEFDMPGHAHAAIVSMEERYRKFHNAGIENEANKYRLVDPDDQSEYISVQQWLDNALNPCINSTYALIGKVMDTIKDLHKDIQPLEIYHFGGDEVAHGAWEKSPACEHLIEINPQYNVTKGIKTYFVERVSKLAADRNLDLAGWEDGFTDGKSDPLSLDKLSTKNTYVQPWNNIWEWGSGKHAYQLANAGYKVILAQATNIYFDHPQEPDPEERGLYWATRFTDTKKVLKFMPDKLYDNIFEERSGKPTNKYEICGNNMEKCDALIKPENILGIQGELWSETVRTSENMDYMIFPRLLALAERAWYKADFEEANEEIRDIKFEDEWKMFANTLGHKELRRLDDIGVKYRVPPPGGRVNEQGTVELSPIYPGLGLQSSNDGGNTWSDVKTNTELKWVANKTLHARTVSAAGDRYSRVVEIQKDEPAEWTSQHVVDYIGVNVDVFFQVIDNLDKVDGFMRVHLELTNTGTMTIPSGTWKIYQYSLYGYREEVLRCGLRVGHINGGLFYVTPDADTFIPIAPGEKISCTLYNKNWLVARTDNMPNWYVSSLGMVPKVIASTTGEDLSYVGNFNTPKQWKRKKEDKYDPYTNWMRYDMYKKFDNSSRQPYRVVPEPSEYTYDEQFTMKFSSDTWTVVESEDFKFESNFLADFLGTDKSTGTTSTERTITFYKSTDTHPRKAEAYSLIIDARQYKNISITANTGKGAFYAVQTLISLIEGNNGILVHTNVHDRPRYPYRGLMIDCARNFKPVEWLKKMIDVMAMYKLNKLHLHLSDDEGWRLEIPSIPELTSVGSKRCHSDYEGDCTIPQLGSGPDKTTSGTGFYTVKEYQDILKYANERHIEVIPELEMPGHATAAIVAMNYRESEIEKLRKYGVQDLPESYLLSKPMNKHKAYSPQKWNGNAMDPCLNTTYTFVSKVLDDLIAIHKDIQPLETVHIGGDEVPEGAWKDSKPCSDAGVNTDTYELQLTFVRAVDKIMAAKGLNLALWDDGIYSRTGSKPAPRDDFQSENVFAYTWDNRGNGTRKIPQFAKAGYKVVMPLATHLYFDQPQEPDPEERGLYWATRYTDTEKVFGLMPDSLYYNIDVDRMGNPLDLDEICPKLFPWSECPSTRSENITGLEGTMFSETIRTEEQFHYMALPRLLALAEKAWTLYITWEANSLEHRFKARDEAWKEFSSNLGYKELPRLDQRNVYYRLPPPGAVIEDGMLKVNTKYPNLLVERSVDNGKSWVTYTDSKLPPGNHTYMLRTKSKTSDVHSRPVKVTANISIVSSAATTAISILLVFTFSLIKLFNILY